MRAKSPRVAGLVFVVIGNESQATPPCDEQAPCLSFDGEIHPSLHLTEPLSTSPPPQPVNAVETTMAMPKIKFFIFLSRGLFYLKFIALYVAALACKAACWLNLFCTRLASFRICIALGGPVIIFGAIFGRAIMSLDDGAILFCIAAYVFMGSFRASASRGFCSMARWAYMAGRVAAARKGWKGKGECQCCNQYCFHFYFRCGIVACRCAHQLYAKLPIGNLFNSCYAGRKKARASGQMRRWVGKPPTCNNPGSA